MKKIIFIILFFVFISCQNNGYSEFKILTKDSAGQYTENDIDSEEITKNIEFVLKTYEIKYIKKGGKIYVANIIFSDKEYMRNIGNKAQDSIWMKENQ